jgi:hypothetical protein
MSDRVAFEGSVEPVVRGRATRTILRLHLGAAAALAAARARRATRIAAPPESLAP